MRAYAKTDMGQKRTTNQDFVYCSIDAVGQLPNLFIVADGMGGHRAGDLASHFTVERFIKAVEESDAENMISIIDEAVVTANSALMDKAKESEAYEGMGTTLVVATIVDHSLFVANIGDSRLYLISDDIHQITRDHSLVEEMVKLGELDKESARTHAKKNIITRAVGANRNVIADFFEIEFSQGDRILMCSDGLTNMVEDKDIKEIIKGSSDIQDAVHKLIKAANDNGGKDNIAVVLVEPDYKE